MSVYLLVVCSAVISLMAVGVLARNARYFGLIDQPGGHKHHAMPVPMVGGIGIAIAAWLMMAMALSAQVHPFDRRLIVALVAAMLLMLVIGLMDDYRGLSPRVRFVGQSVAALLLMAGGVRLDDLGALIDGSHTLQLGLFVWPMTVFSMVGVMNACNMSDGIDGIAGSLALVALIAALLLTGGHGVDAVLLACTAGAVAGFLFWNAPLLGSARAYLGDGGSLLLGIVLAWLLVALSQGAQRAFSPVAALWLYAVPLIDTVSVMWRRMAERRSPFQADQRHLHHVMLRSGFSVRQSWALISTVAVLLAGIGVAGARLNWSEPLLAIGFLLLAGLHHQIMRRADRQLLWLGRPLALDVATAQAQRSAKIAGAP